MQARDLMTRSVTTVRPEAPVREAVAVLLGKGFAALPVVDDRGRVVGILSESNGLIAGPSRRGPSVEAAMTSPAQVVSPSTDISTVAAQMIQGRLRSVPVVEAGVLVGIVSRRDLLRALICDDAAVEAKIRSLLDEYAGSRRGWSIAVAEGKVEIGGGFANKEEQRIVGALARTVDGVRHVDVFPTAMVV